MVGANFPETGRSGFTAYGICLVRQSGLVPDCLLDGFCGRLASGRHYRNSEQQVATTGS